VRAVEKQREEYRAAKIITEEWKNQEKELIFREFDGSIRSQCFIMFAFIVIEIYCDYCLGN